MHQTDDICRPYQNSLVFVVIQLVFTENRSTHLLFVFSAFLSECRLLLLFTYRFSNKRNEILCIYVHISNFINAFYI